MPYWPMGGRARNADLTEEAFAKERGEGQAAGMERPGGTGIAL
ncbi:hypothetical protein [Microvirga splendida]|nr:hypothetical protein [Microvirga splendida]